MQLNDDLLGVVSLYATTKVTLDLLCAFAPQRVYGASPPIWRHKSLYESRGLIQHPIEDWYAYYLERNRTWHGNLLQAKVTAGGSIKDGRTKRGGTTITGRGVIFYHSHLVFTWNVVTLTQYDDLSIEIGNEASRSEVCVPSPIQMRSKIRWATAVYHTAPNILIAFVLVDEYGDVWLTNAYTALGGLTRYYTGVVSIAVSSSSKFDVTTTLYMLDRDGVLFMVDPAKGLGRIIRVEETAPYRVVSLIEEGTSVRAVDDHGVTRLGAPSPLPREQWDTLRVVRATSNIALTTDRTLYNTYLRGTPTGQIWVAPLEVRGTTHRTQYAHQATETSSTLSVIVDFL